MDQNMLKDDIGSVGIKTGFTLSISAVGSWSMDELIQLVTLLYLVLQIGLLALKYWRVLRKRGKEEGHDE
jgi:hypothetical protein